MGKKKQPVYFNPELVKVGQMLFSKEPELQDLGCAMFYEFCKRWERPYYPNIEPIPGDSFRQNHIITMTRSRFRVHLRRLRAARNNRKLKPIPEISEMLAKFTDQ